MMSEQEKIEKLIDDYADKYAVKHHVTKEEAKKHAMVKIASAYFEEDNKNENRTH